MRRWIRVFRREDEAQDLIEYTLLLGFVVLAVIGFFMGAGGSAQGIWTVAGSRMDQAATVAAAGTTTPSPDHGDHHGDGGDSGRDGDSSGDGH